MHPLLKPLYQPRKYIVACPSTLLLDARARLSQSISKHTTNTDEIAIDSQL